MKSRNSDRVIHSVQGPMLAVFLVFLVLASSWLFTQRRWWLPDLASAHGVDIDRVFLVTLVWVSFLRSFTYCEEKGCL
jgi:hypothetical protein